MTRGSARLTFATLAALLVGAALAFTLTARSPRRADAATPPASPPAARRAIDERFDAACSGCHTRKDLARRIRDAADPEARAREFERFLASHGGTSDQEDRDIVRWLRGAGS
jgi:mono/diheme cytochrome c family protein